MLPCVIEIFSLFQVQKCVKNRCTDAVAQNPKVINSKGNQDHIGDVPTKKKGLQVSRLCMADTYIMYANSNRLKRVKI